ncbi:MAG: hypothetical protein ACLFU6_13065, partial [Candidatus Hydrogenedentota bacterium]
MKKLTVALSVLAILGLAMPAMAEEIEDSKEVDVEITVEAFAEILWPEGAQLINVVDDTGDNKGEVVPFEIHANDDYEFYAH